MSGILVPETFSQGSTAFADRGPATLSYGCAHRTLLPAGGCGPFWRVRGHRGPRFGTVKGSTTYRVCEKMKIQKFNGSFFFKFHKRRALQTGRYMYILCIYYYVGITLMYRRIASN